jgi:23S rRNA (uracil1939-C5)-methyltransferase
VSKTLTKTFVVTGLAHGGAGVVRRPDEPTVFCPGALPGERIAARVVRQRRRWAEAELVEVLEASPVRRTPACPIIDHCGGCTLQHADPDWARSALVEAARHDIGRALGAAALDVLRDPVASPLALRYRCRIRVHLNPAGEFGFYPAGGGPLVTIDDCLLAPEGLTAALAGVPIELRERLARGGWSDVEIREGRDGRRDLDAQAARGARGDTAGTAEAKALAVAISEAGGWFGVRVGESRRGEAAVRYEVAGVSLTAGPGAFVQANPGANSLLVDAVLTLAGDVRGMRVLDLYGGIGNLGLPLAKAGADVEIVESGAEATRWARSNTDAAGLGERVRIHETPAERALDSRAPGSVDLIVLDPPRSGAADAIDGIARLAPPRILYVSCHLHTLLRDLGQLGAAWRPTDIVPVDMFPQTGRLEWIVALARTNGQA